MHTYGSTINILSHRCRLPQYQWVYRVDGEVVGWWGSGVLKWCQPFPVSAAMLPLCVLKTLETLSQPKKTERSEAAAKSHFELLKHSERLYPRLLS